MQNSTTAKMRLATKYRLIILTSLYFLVWFALRFPPINANILVADDYFNFVDHSSTIVDVDSCSNPFKDYRTVYVGIRCFSATYFPDFSLSVWPKLLGGFFLSCFSLLAFLAARSWGSPKLLAALMPLPLICHPITSEITLWNMTGVYSLWLAFCAFAYIVFSKPSTKAQRALALSALIVSALAYEFYLTTFLVFALAGPLVMLSNKKDWNIQFTVRLIGIFLLVSLIYLTQVKLINLMLPEASNSARGLVRVPQFETYLIEKIHGVFNLLVNVFATPVSFFTGILPALKVWEFIPITIVVATTFLSYFYHRSAQSASLVAILSVAVIIVPTLPIFASSQSPESWRVSIPVLIGSCCLLLALTNLIFRVAQNHLCGLAGQGLSSIITIGISGLLAISTIEEAKLRVYESALEDKLLNEIITYWNSKSLSKSDIKIGRISGLNTNIATNNKQASRMSVAYRERGIYSNLKTNFAWRGKLLHNGFQVIELGDSQNSFSSHYSQNCSNPKSSCLLEAELKMRSNCLNSSSYFQQETGIRLAHDDKLQISIICF